MDNVALVDVDGDNEDDLYQYYAEEYEHDATEPSLTPVSYELQVNFKEGEQNYKHSNIYKPQEKPSN